MAVEIDQLRPQLTQLSTQLHHFANHDDRTGFILAADLSGGVAFEAWAIFEEGDQLADGDFPDAIAQAWSEPSSSAADVVMLLTELKSLRHKRCSN